MTTGWRYRFASAAGTLTAIAFAVLLANHSLAQRSVTTYVPLAARLDPVVLSGTDLVVTVALSMGVVFCCLIPLYEPRPRRILDTVFLIQKRVLTAMFALATLGYFNWSYRLPRATLGVTTGLLLIVLPTWFVAIRNRPARNDTRAIIVGNNSEQIERAAATIDTTVLGYLSPPITDDTKSYRDQTTATDGGTLQTTIGDVDYFGGISRLDRILVDHNIDTVVLAFGGTDRGDFFGVLETCHAYGVGAKVFREHATSVLFFEETAGKLLTVDLEPWDWQDRLFKRAFDIVFAGIGLVVFAPLLGLIALAIKLDSPGPVFYIQKRTAGFGGTFEVQKFRTMLPNSESIDPVDDENNTQITRVGQLLRKSNLDELPQLWAILRGNMSVVGPRAVWTNEETLLEQQTVEWRKRWFVKPGLTGSAQVNDVSSTDPEVKLQYDLEYIRKRSFWLDVKIVLRQVWITIGDVWDLIVDQNDAEARTDR